jgi:hypothetical protein
MHFHIVNSSGHAVMRGNDFSALLKQFRSGPDAGPLAVSPEDQELMDSVRDRVFTSWDFAAYPERIPLLASKEMIGGYLFCGLRPVAEKKGVTLHYFSSRKEADSSTRKGINYLIRLELREKFKQLARHCRLTFSGPSALWLTTFSGGPAQTCETVLNFIVDSFLTTAPREMLRRENYRVQVDEMRKIDVFTTGREIIDKVLFVLRRRKETFDLIANYERLAKKAGSFDADLFNDLYTQLEVILPADFLDRFELSDLDNCSRHLKGLAIRSERAYNNPGKDLAKRKKLTTHQQNLDRFTQRSDDLGPECEEKLENYKKLLAEMRISLFSPEIKTLFSVSEKKLANAWQDLIAGC